jgi:porin
LLADPAGSGVPIRHQGNYSLYAIIDQQIYRPRGGDARSGISVFGRAAFTPSDRNLVNFQIDGGVVFAGMIPQRPGDQFGASVLYARFSDRVRAFDRDTVTFGTPTPIRDYETNLELTYQAQIVPGWTVQPTVTFIWHPSGDASRNATVAGVRSLWRY